MFIGHVRKLDSRCSDIKVSSESERAFDLAPRCHMKLNGNASSLSVDP
jgi:hypothetical protein